MKRKVFILLLCLILSFACVGCSGKKIENNNPDGTVYKVLMANTRYVFTFRDPDTGVWYICSGDSITPRLNSDGSYFTSEVK